MSAILETFLVGYSLGIGTGFGIAMCCAIVSNRQHARGKETPCC